MSQTDIVWKPVSEFYNDDRSKKAIVNIDIKAQYYFIDFYDNKTYINTISYPGKSYNYVEDAAENYTLGILNVKAS